MLSSPILNLLHILFAVEIARVLPAPLLLARMLTGHLTFRVRAEPLVAGILRMGSEPSPAMTTLS